METKTLTLPELLRERIVQARKDAGLSQEGLASELGLDGSAISKIENGTRNLSSVELVKLAEICGKTVDWFFSKEDSPFFLLRGASVSSETRRDAAWLCEFSETFSYLARKLAGR